MTTQIVTISIDDLRAMLREEIARVAPPAPASDILTREQVAELLSVHPQVVTRYVRNDGLVGFKLGPSWRFRRAEVEKWLEERAIRPGAPTKKHGAALRRVKGGT